MAYKKPLPDQREPSAPPTYLSDVQKRINAALKIFDEEVNRTCIGENVSFEEFITKLRWSVSSLQVWLSVQELLTRKDHLSFVWMLNSWEHHMIVKFFVYRSGVGLDRKRWSDPKAIAMKYLQFKNRATPHNYKAVKEAFKHADKWNMPYWETLKQIWEMDPDKAQNVWKTIWPDPQELPEPTK